MPQHLNNKLQTYFATVVYVGTASTDATTNLARRLKQLTGEMTARFKAIIAAAGGSN